MVEAEGVVREEGEGLACEACRVSIVKYILT